MFLPDKIDWCFANRSAGQARDHLDLEVEAGEPVTPTAVQFGKGGSPKTVERTALMSANWFSGSVWKVVTSTMSSKEHPAAARTAARLSNARWTWARNSGSGDPSSRLPTWPLTNSRSPERIAAEYWLMS
jgi:hypothetical protein